MHEISESLPDERVSVIRGRKRIAAKQGESRERVEMTGGLLVEGSRRWAAWKHPSVILGRQQGAYGLTHGESRVAEKSSFRDRFVSDRNCIPGEKAVSPIIPRESKLASTGDRLDHSRVRAESKVVSA